jgi:two-component system, OmpR family, sensor kinase
VWASVSPEPGARPAGSLRRQLVLLSAAVTALAAALLTLLVQLLLAHATTGALEQVLRDRCADVASAVEGASPGGTIVVPDATLVAGVAVYDASGTLVAGSAPSALAAVYAQLSTVARPTVTDEVAGTDRVRAQPFTLASGTRGVVVVSERIRPYEQVERYALVVSVATGLLAVLASAVLAAWVSRRALRPVVAMAGTASEWSEHDLSRRFDLGPPTNEISALAATLDGLLDKVSAAIRSEQRLTSELAHELRTPLTAVQGSAELVLLRPGLDDRLRGDVEAILTGTHQMASTITALLDLARSSTTRAEADTADLRAALERVVPASARVVLDVEPVTVALPAALVERAVGPVVENAVRHAEHVTVRLVPGRPGCVAVAVDDDGPGVEPAEQERIFEAGHTSGDHAGSGLGLPLARRIARSAGGDVVLRRTETGSRFVVELPRA